MLSEDLLLDHIIKDLKDFHNQSKKLLFDTDTILILITTHAWIPWKERLTVRKVKCMYDIIKRQAGYRKQ